MELHEFLPDQPEFSLKSTQKTYKLRVINLHDQVYFRSLFGDETKIQEVFQNQDWANICKIVYRLMEDRSDFVSIKETVINDDGDQVEIKVSGPERLLKSISGAEEGVRMMAALTRSITLSNPAIEKYVTDEVKKNQVAPLTGQKSTTSLLQSTDLPQASSGT